MRILTALFLGSALTAILVGPAVAADAPAAPAAPAATAPPAASLLPPAATAAKDQPVRIGYVDMAQIAAETDSGKAATAALKEKSQKLSAKIEAKKKQIEKQKAAIEAKIETLTPKERAAKSKEFNKKLDEYQKLLRESDQEMQEMQEKLTTEMYQAIKKAAASYGMSHGYAAVLVKKDLLYLADVPDPKDLTEEIVAELNKKPAAK